MCGVIVVDAESFRSTCLYTWSCLDILITIRFSINCSIVIRSPTVILMLSWEKPLVKPMAPGSIFHLTSFRSTFILQSLLLIYIIKIPKIFILLSLSDLTLVSDREGIDNPFIALVARFLFVLCRCEATCALSPTGLIPWFSKTEGNTYATVLHHPFLFKGIIRRKLKR